MHDFISLLLDVLRNSFLITGLVMIMMLMIEFINIRSEGRWFSKLRQHRFGQVVLGAGLGIIPGCMGGFAAVSMYSHRLLSFGALVAMMIASSGDEAFVMLTLIPKETLLLIAILFAVAILVGWIVDCFTKKEKHEHLGCDEEFQVHHEEHQHGATKEKSSIKNLRHASAERIALLLGVGIFIIALAFGMFEHEHDHEAESIGNVSIFDEYWMNLFFAIVSLAVVWFISTANEHIIKEHLWEHVIRKHFLSIFLWTLGALLVIEIGLHYMNMESWISSNIPWMILLALLVGIIPESGPHLLFVTLFATGTIPFSVLLASSISQDGHASLPLLAESKIGFVKAKIINAIVAAVVGYTCYFIGF